MGIDWNEVSSKSFGGTESMARRLEAALPEQLASEVQIIPSRVRKLDEKKARILWCHDLPGDPESEHLKNEGWRKFHVIVFVSYWQREAYVRYYGIPYSHTIVLHNAIDPITVDEKPDAANGVRFIYSTTPHRGLDICFKVFEELCKKHDNLHLDVFSSFSIYGWDERDKEHEALFDEIKAHKNCTYHGYQPNEIVRQALVDSHVWVLPSTWQETSCISLMEAISAKCVCVHSDLAALPETSANWTHMYPFHESKPHHAAICYNYLDTVIDVLKDKEKSANILRTTGAKTYADFFYKWDIRKHEWIALIERVLPLPRELPKKEFRYRSF